MKQDSSQRHPWPTTTIAKSSYLKGRIGWQGLKASEFLPEGPYLVTGTDFYRGRIRWDTCYHVSDARFAEAGYIHIRNGDLLVTKDGTIGKVAYVEECPEKAVLNSGIFVLRCHDGSYDHRYMFYILQSDYFKEFLDDNLAGSTIQHLYQYIFENFKFPVPRKAEQIKIAQILSTIDSAIEQTEALIAKQQRVKAGLMQDLLTRGIDKHGHLRTEQTHKFKDSPLGRIPEEWEIVKVDDIAEYVGSGITPRGGESVYETNGVLFIRSQNVQFGGLELHDAAFIPKQIHLLMQRSEVHENDVLLNITGASIGRCCRMPKISIRSNVNQHVCIVRLHDVTEAKSGLLAAIFESDIGQHQITRLNAGGNREGLNYQQVRNFLVPWSKNPGEFHTLNEVMKSIVDKIHQQQLSLEKLYAIKTGLMRNLLTGERGVRGESTKTFKPRRRAGQVPCRGG